MAINILTKRRVRPGDKKHGFLKLLIDGEAKLYKYSILAQNYSATINSSNGISMGPSHSSYEDHYYIERNDKFDLVNSNRFYQIIKRLLPSNKNLHKKIKNRDFSINSIYYVVKYFNENVK